MALQEQGQEWLLHGEARLQEEVMPVPTAFSAWCGEVLITSDLAGKRGGEECWCFCTVIANVKMHRRPSAPWSMRSTGLPRVRADMYVCVEYGMCTWRRKHVCTLK